MFWRDMGWNDEEDAVEARDGVCSMTDMFGDNLFWNSLAVPIGFCSCITQGAGRTVASPRCVQKVGLIGKFESSAVARRSEGIYIND